jgi:Fe-S-cluster containining protein
MPDATSFPQAGRQEIELNDRFTFECSEKCMGNCCRLITILLDPWDIEVMSRYLKLPGTEFLDLFCSYDFGTTSHWPFVWLKHAEKGCCAFMLPDGKCSIYPARPRNCRTYPVGRAVKIEAAGEVPRLTERLFLMVEKNRPCLGHDGERVWTVREWLAAADAFKYYELSDLYLALVHYASETLNCRAWLTPNTARILMPLLFTPDLLRKKLGIGEEVMDHETFYRRRLKATRVILTEMAASFGFGPLAGQDSADQEMSLATRLRQLILPDA